MLRSDHAHALIKSVDVAAARSLPGVVVVLTSADILEVLEDIPSSPMAGERMVEQMNPPTHPVLAKDKVRHIDTPLTPEKLWRAIHGKEETLA